MKAKHWKRTFLLMLFEGALIYGCGLMAILLRFGADAGAVLTQRQGLLKLLVAMAVTQGAFYLFDLYDFGMIRRLSVLAIRLCQALGLAAMLLALLFYLLPHLMLGRGVFLTQLALMLTIMTGWRLIARWLLGHPRLAERVIILGTEQQAIDLAREVLNRREAGYEVVGFIGDDPALIGKSLINPCVIGTADDLEAVTRRYNADRIVVALTDRRGRMPLDTLLNLKLRDDVVVEDWANFFERLTGKISTDRLQPSQLIFADNMRWIRFYRRVRRVADIIIASIGLVLSAPLMLLTALLIKLESAGPIFYSQERVGQHDQPFHIIKFRSMRTDAEKNGAVWASKDDPRVTRVGRIIRKLRIDELPQFINVLRGEMSMIGPRPERRQFVQQLSEVLPYYSQRHLVKPGITGWAQVCYPYGASVEDARMKHQYDLYYIKNQSPLLDAVILFETLRVVFFGRLGR
ncbi:MAG: TIGR03013 family PEP-CTERM/XrtA system glycosyltransferase [Acidobacteria bacterium]|nr:TIGR03013 family PEP-CTERM/XrtA system glycosyltransferase [Acidobacteriota bacterium]MBI3422757.1 TIGR03013 family PEP-CTERM/XrtA system glycosyltransferase [Acidobacteriota bacterium]